MMDSQLSYRQLDYDTASRSVLVLLAEEPQEQVVEFEVEAVWSWAQRQAATLELTVG